MENFIAYNPVKLIFGRDVVNARMKRELSVFGSNVLLIYGKGSIKRNGIYSQVLTILKESGKNVFEYGGIKSNPLCTDAQAAVQLAYENKADMVLAVGGGSVIDTAKLVALCSPANDHVWKVMKGEVKPARALPLVSVLTLAATGTEMNQFAVLQNPDTGEKIGFGSPLVYPAVSFLDPAYMVSVPVNYTAYGIADICAHLLEAYFGEGDAPLSDKWVFAIMRELIEVGEPLLKDPGSYTLRERVLWASTQALNGTTLHGRKSGEWGVHDIGHTISFLYDIPHGATLSVAYPAWMKHLLPHIQQRLKTLGENVFGVNDPEKTIEALTHFFRKISCPVSLAELNLQDKKSEILNLMIKNKVSGMHFKLTEEDLLRIVGLM